MKRSETTLPTMLATVSTAMMSSKHCQRAMEASSENWNRTSLIAAD